ncbi:hypothetical protein [Neisseria sp. 74A18]|uniref:hypothetical protein n=1 Tax=Neisseria sp. 74A18 TaxID=1696094 RepID=UPI000B0749A2|nr:hypothetical protein [Neisseria sp. 74A18]
MTDTPSDAAVSPPKPKSRTLKDSLKWYKTTFKLLLKYWYLWLAIIMLSTFISLLFNFVGGWLQETLATHLPTHLEPDALLPLIMLFISITLKIYLTGAFLVSAESVIENKQILTENIWKKWRSGFTDMAKLSVFCICILSIESIIFGILTMLSTTLDIVSSTFQNNPEHYTLDMSHDFFYMTLLTTAVTFLFLTPLWFMLPLLTLNKVTFKQTFSSSFNGMTRNILPLSIYLLPTLLLILFANQTIYQILDYFFNLDIYDYTEAIEITLYYISPVLITLQLYIPYRDIYISPISENQLKQ